MKLVFFNDFDPKKKISVVFAERNLKLLSDFTRNKTIIVTKPDKSWGVLILKQRVNISKVGQNYF